MKYRTLLVSIAVALVVLTTLPVASVSAAGDGDVDATGDDCQVHVPEDPDCDGDMERPGEDYDGDQHSGGLIGAIVDIIAGLF